MTLRSVSRFLNTGWLSSLTVGTISFLFFVTYDSTTDKTLPLHSKAVDRGYTRVTAAVKIIKGDSNKLQCMITFALSQ